MNVRKMLGPIVLGGVTIAFLASFLPSNQATPRPYSLEKTLPAMLSAFGRHARVVSIELDAKDIYDEFVRYEVIGSDGELHDRVYHRTSQPSLDNYHGVSYARRVDNSVRPPTAAELRVARLYLAQISPRVVDELFKQVDFKSDESEAELSGNTWTLSTNDFDVKHDLDVYQARYDGADLRQTQSPPPVFGTAQPSTAGATTQPVRTIARPHTTAPAKTIPIAPGVDRSGRFLACVKAADDKVVKLAACVSRYGPR